MEQVKVVSFRRHIPNIVSLVRIVGTLILPLLMWESWSLTVNLPMLGEFHYVPLVWIIVFLLLAVTDKVDGTLARKIKAESELGALLDIIGDILLLFVGVICVFANFARGSLTDFQFWFYIFIVLEVVFNKFLAFAVTKKYFGKGNMLHSIPHKAFTVGTYIAVALWAFIQTVPLWSVLILWAIVIYGVIDEIIYIVRAAEYNVDFKGHGFEKYRLKKTQ